MNGILKGYIHTCVGASKGDFGPFNATTNAEDTEGCDNFILMFNSHRWLDMILLMSYVHDESNNCKGFLKDHDNCIMLPYKHDWCFWIDLKDSIHTIIIDSCGQAEWGWSILSANIHEDVLYCSATLFWAQCEGPRFLLSLPICLRVTACHFVDAIGSIKCVNQDSKYDDSVLCRTTWI